MAEGGYVGPTTGSNPEEMGQRSDSELSEEEPHLLTVAWLPSMTWGCPRMGVPQARWMVYFMENPTKKWMIWRYPHDLGNLHLEDLGRFSWEIPADSVIKVIPRDGQRFKYKLLWQKAHIKYLSQTKRNIYSKYNYIKQLGKSVRSSVPKIATLHLS